LFTIRLAWFKIGLQYSLPVLKCQLAGSFRGIVGHDCSQFVLPGLKLVFGVHCRSWVGLVLSPIGFFSFLSWVVDCSSLTLFEEPNFFLFALFNSSRDYSSNLFGPFDLSSKQPSESSDNPSNASPSSSNSRPATLEPHVGVLANLVIAPVTIPTTPLDHLTSDRVHVVGAHFVTIRLALNRTFWLNCQQQFNFWAVGRRKFPSSSTLLDVRYVPSPYRATTVTQLWAMGRRKTHLQTIVVDCRP
jgi:hypothetical protein